MLSPIEITTNIVISNSDWKTRTKFIKPPLTNNYSKMNVSSLIKLNENNRLFDCMVGWIDGINSVNQEKHYVSMNSISFEKNQKKGRKNIGHMKCSLMIYYICQETDFFSWYNDHDTTHVHTGF